MKDIQMNLTTLFLLLSLTFSINSHALSLKGYFGAAKSIGDMTGTSSVDRVQFRLGGLVDYPLAKSIYLRIGLGISQRGSEISHALYTVTEDRVFLDIPLLLAYDFQRFQVYAGANLSTRLSSKCKVSDPSISCADNNTAWLVFQPILGMDSQELYGFRVGLFYEPPVEYQKNWDQYSVGLNISKSFGSTD